MHSCLALLCSIVSTFSTVDTLPAPVEKPIGSVLRTVREMEMTGDTTKEVLQIETTKAKRFDKILVRFGIYINGKNVFQDQWKASTYFDPRDKWSDTTKWKHLTRILRGFFVNQNFTMSGDENLHAILERAEVADIHLNTREAKEFDFSPHKLFSVYGGRNHLYALTWLESKKKFVKVWKN